MVLTTGSEDAGQRCQEGDKNIFILRILWCSATVHGRGANHFLAGVEILIGSCVLHLGSRISVALCQDARWRGEPVREQETSADA